MIATFISLQYVKKLLWLVKRPVFDANPKEKLR
jgi:hypothetical protein